ncbi:MAG: cytochrome c biogenesis protein ResB [Ichthyobacteriaceae bacterium]|nr:cytochrome c biogenesis protein ResB [Ichthyobacteriaceae bacterium]
MSIKYTKSNHPTHNKNNNKPIWECPWGYEESYLIGFSLIFIGFMLEFFGNGNIAPKLIFPNNIYFGTIYVLILILAYVFFRNTKPLKWFVAVPTAISSLVLIIVLVMIMGIIPQDVSYGGDLINKFGLNRMTTNWTFFFILFYFLSALGFITIKRTHQLIIKKDDFNIRNIGFVLNHFGLWFAIIIAVLGANDIQHLKITIDENKPYNVATNNEGKDVSLDFFITLNKFTVKEFAPKLAIVDNVSGKILHNNGKNLFEITDSLSYIFKNYSIEVSEYIENSAPIGKKYASVYQMGSLPSAKIKVTNTLNTESTEGWICCGNFMYQYQSLKFSKDYSLLMTMPEVKHFESKVTFFSKTDLQKQIPIEVNKPYDFGGYKIYQLGYEEKKGKWSEYSILELVKDPWLNTVYFGLYLLLAGTLILLLTGKRSSK